MTESLSLKKCRDKLLDLGKKNRLLYFSYGASALRILSPEKEWLFDAIKGGKKVPFFDLDSYLENPNVSDPIINQVRTASAIHS